MSAVDDFHNRLAFEGDPHSLIVQIATQYGFNDVKSSQVVTSGFEDCNFIIEADDKKLFVKCYAKSRTPEDIDRSIQVLDAVADSDINHPYLYSTADGLVSKVGDVRAIMMDCIDGKSFHELDRSPTEDEAKLVLAEAVKINELDIDPPFIYDSMALINIHDMYESVSKYITEADDNLVRPVLEGFDEIGIDALPKAFVHGDLISTNVMLDNKGKIWVVDFSVANTYPKVQELAVISSSLMHSSNESLKEVVEKMASFYETCGGSLTAKEKAALFALARAGQAMELLGSYYYTYINTDNIEEAAHWQEVGRKGLQASEVKNRF
jgi:Ser/Thr protein kinase RdoA (MazF antagonist)